MDISARVNSLADKPRTGYRGHQGSYAPGRPILHRRLCRGALIRPGRSGAERLGSRTVFLGGGPKGRTARASGARISRFTGPVRPPLQSDPPDARQPLEWRSGRQSRADSGSNRPERPTACAKLVPAKAGIALTPCLFLRLAGRFCTPYDGIEEQSQYREYDFSSTINEPASSLSCRLRSARWSLVR